MNVEGDLELGRRPLRQVDELPELVDLQPEGRRTVLNGTVRPAPARDRREPPGPRRGLTRVAREDRGLTRVTPADITGRDAAIGRADVLADREVEVVTVQAGAVVPRRVPELREARIEIEVRLPADPSHQRFEREVAADVQQQVRRFRRRPAARDTRGRGSRARRRK